MEYCAVFLTLLFNFDCFLVGSLSNNILKICALVVPIIVCFLLIAPLIFKIKTKSIDIHYISKMIILLLSFILLFLVTYLFNLKKEPYLSIGSLIDSMEYTYVYQFVFLILSFFVVLVISGRKFLKAVYIFTFVSSFFAVILFAIGKISPTIFSSLPTIINSSGISFKWFVFAVTNTADKIYAFAREPGVYAIYFLLSIYYLVFVNPITKKKLFNLIPIIVLVTTVVFTKSTTCYLVLLLVFIAFLITKKYRVITKIVILGIFVLVSLLSIELIKTVVIEKMNNNQSTSLGSRLLSIPVCVQMFFMNPFAGIGWSSYKIFFNNYSSAWQFYDFHITNTIFYGFSIYGLAFGILTIISIFYLFKAEREKGSRIFLTMSFITFLFSENVLNSSFYLIIVFFSLKDFTLLEKLNNSVIGKKIRIIVGKIRSVEWKKILPIIITLIGSVSSLILTFSLASKLDTEAYGEIQYQLGLMTTLSVVMQFGLPNILAKNSQFEANKKALFSKYFLLTTIVSVFAFPIFFVICYFALSGINNISTIMIVFGGAYFSSLALIISYYQMGIEKRINSALTYSFLPKIIMLLASGCSLIFGVLTLFGKNYMLAFFISYLVVCIPPIIQNLRLTKLKFSKQEILSISIFLGISVLSTAETQLGKIFQRELTSNLTSTAALGLSTQIMSIVMLFFNSVTSIFRPEFAKRFQKNGKESCISLYSSLTGFLSCFSIAFCIGCALQTDIILSLFNTKYVSYSLIFLLITFETLIVSLAGPVSTLVSMTGFERAELIGGAINLSIFVLLSLTLGRIYWWGIALAIAAGRLCSIIPHIVIVRKYYNCWIFNKKLLLSFIIEAGVSVGAFLIIRFLDTPLLCLILDFFVGILLVAVFSALPTNRTIFKTFFNKKLEDSQL